MTDTKPLAPTDKQLGDFAVEEQFLLFCDADEFTQIARAVLDKWGTPPAVAGEPVAYRHMHDDGWEYYDAPTGSDCPGCEPLYTTPQPTQAQATAVPLTDEQTESLLWKYGYDPDDEHMAAMLKEAHGIKGGQHGTE